MDLVIGVDGFVGRNMLNFLHSSGRETLTISRSDGDLRDHDRVLSLFSSFPKMERIFHLVTHQRTGQIQYSIPAQLLDTNARIHLNVLDAWARYQPQAKLISTGSSCAYPESDDPIGEDLFQTGRLHESVRAYGLAKQLLAVGSEVYGSQYGLRWLHCILATLYGPHDHSEPDRAHFVGGMMTRAIQEKEKGLPVFSVWGSPNTIRECLHVEDQIEAILAADRVFENRLLNCAANSPVTVGEVGETIREVLSWDVEIEYPQGTFQGTSKKVLDSSTFLNATGWKPRMSLNEGLSRLHLELTAST